MSIASEKASPIERLVILPDGWFPDGTERPVRKAKVLSEENGWARVQYLDDSTEETVTTKAFLS